MATVCFHFLMFDTGINSNHLLFVFWHAAALLILSFLVFNIHRKLRSKHTHSSAPHHCALVLSEVCCLVTQWTVYTEKHKQRQNIFSVRCTILHRDHLMVNLCFILCAAQWIVMPIKRTGNILKRFNQYYLKINKNIYKLQVRGYWVY